MRQVRNAYKILDGNSEGMRVFMGPRSREENDIKVRLMGYESVECIKLA
jgi:hypothetical protein